MNIVTKVLLTSGSLLVLGGASAGVLSTVGAESNDVDNAATQSAEAVADTESTATIVTAQSTTSTETADAEEAPETEDSDEKATSTSDTKKPSKEDCDKEEATSES